MDEMDEIERLTNILKELMESVMSNTKTLIEITGRIEKLECRISINDIKGITNDEQGKIRSKRIED